MKTFCKWSAKFICALDALWLCRQRWRCSEQWAMSHGHHGTCEPFCVYMLRFTCELLYSRPRCESAPKWTCCCCCCCREKQEKNVQHKLRNYSINNERNERRRRFTMECMHTASAVWRWHNNMIMTINVWAFLLLLQFTKEFIECIFARRTMFHVRPTATTTPPQYNASDSFFLLNARSFVGLFPLLVYMVLHSMFGLLVVAPHYY